MALVAGTRSKGHCIGHERRSVRLETRIYKGNIWHEVNNRSLSTYNLLIWLIMAFKLSL